jgi:hypothetical protein
MLIMKKTKYNNYYVDENGNVYSDKSGVLKPLKPWVDSQNRYLYVSLGKKHKSVHRLIAETYLPNPNNYKEVNHIDGNTKNNMLANLEWCSRKQNISHSINVLNNSPIRNFINAKVYKGDEIIKECKSIKEACRFIKEKYNIPFSMMYKHKSYNDIKIVTENCTPPDKKVKYRGEYRNCNDYPKGE